MSDTIVEREWYEDSEAVVALAEWLAKRGADGMTVFGVFQRPWEFCVEHDAMIAEFTDGLEGLLHG